MGRVLILKFAVVLLRLGLFGNFIDILAVGVSFQQKLLTFHFSLNIEVELKETDIENRDENETTPFFGLLTSDYLTYRVIFVVGTPSRCKKTDQLNNLDNQYLILLITNFCKHFSSPKHGFSKNASTRFFTFNELYKWQFQFL